MPCYDGFTLANGLRVRIQPIPESTTVVVNIMYHVGSCNEAPHATGMAHLLEHIMFGGSRHVPAYDQALQKVGGINNAYTSNDVTNYWSKLPANKLEVALWLESDRLLAPSYAHQVIETQRRIVIEEFKQVCLNKPYGNVWHTLSSQAYQTHPYQWPTIGKEIKHIASMTQAEIIDFGKRFYIPQNAVVVIVGGIKTAQAYQLVKKWFEDIPNKPYQRPQLSQEPIQKAPSHHTIYGHVPQNALYKTYHTLPRNHPDYIYLKLLANFLGEGDASLLYDHLVVKQGLFSEIEVYTTETVDPGLLVIEGKLQEGVSLVQSEKALQKLLDQTIQQGISAKDFEKAKNQAQAAYLFDRTDPIHQAESLAYATLLGNSDLFAQEIAHISDLDPLTLQDITAKTLSVNNSHTLYYMQQT